MGETVPLVLALPYSVAQPVTINLTATAGLQVPASLTLAAGETSRTFNAQATAIGSPVLSASPASTNTAFEPAQLAFSISAAVPTGPVISSVAPNAGAPGTPVTLSGSGFSATPGGNTVVFTGNAPAVVQSASATQLVVTVPATAQTGPISVTTTAGTGTSPVFTVQRDQAFDLQSSPAQLSVMQGSQASAVITLASSGVRPYEGLARLSITGLPAGVTARFEPAQISAQQGGQLILSAASSAALGSSIHRSPRVNTLSVKHDSLSVRTNLGLPNCAMVRHKCPSSVQLHLFERRASRTASRLPWSTMPRTV